MCFVHRKTRLLLIGKHGWHQNGWQKQNMAPMWKKIWKMWTLTNPHLFLITCTWVARNENANQTQRSLNSTQRCVSYVFLLEQQKNYVDGKNLTHNHKRGPTIWKDMLKNALSDTVNWQKRKWSNFTKSRTLVWMIIIPNKKNSNQLENCQKFARKLSWIGVNKLARAVNKWTQACDRRLARLISYIAQTISDNIVMWETRHSIAGFFFFKTPTLLVISKTQSQLQDVSCAFLEVEHLY